MALVTKSRAPSLSATQIPSQCTVARPSAATRGCVPRRALEQQRARCLGIATDSAHISGGLCPRRRYGRVLVRHGLLASSRTSLAAHRDGARVRTVTHIRIFRRYLAQAGGGHSRALNHAHIHEVISPRYLAVVNGAGSTGLDSSRIIGPCTASYDT